MNLLLTVTTGLSGVLQRAKKFDMLSTIMAHPRFRMDRPFSRSTCVLPWIASAASACASVQPPDQRGKSWPQKRVILDFDYGYASCYSIDMDSSVEDGNHLDSYPHISFLSPLLMWVSQVLYSVPIGKSPCN
jgi:hypothetical protein